MKRKNRDVISWIGINLSSKAKSAGWFATALGVPIKIISASLDALLKRGIARFDIKRQGWKRSRK